ncbi:unnamed protein product, partial [Musa acuminata subsp. malaccensis]
MLNGPLLRQQQGYWTSLLGISWKRHVLHGLNYSSTNVRFV